MLLLLRVKTELSKVRASLKIAEDDFFRLKVFIVADWKLAIAYFRWLIVLLRSIKDVNLEWLLCSIRFTFFGGSRSSGFFRLLTLTVVVVVQSYIA